MTGTSAAAGGAGDTGDTGDTGDIGDIGDIGETVRADRAGERSAVDTSVLVRYFVQDHPTRGRATQQLVDGAQEICISLVALAETALVLLRNYGVPREAVVDALVGLLRKRNVQVLSMDKTLAAAALLLCRSSGRVSFADALINVDARSHGVTTLYAFDEQFPTEGLTVRSPEEAPE